LLHIDTRKVNTGRFLKYSFFRNKTFSSEYRITIAKILDSEKEIERSTTYLIERNRETVAVWMRYFYWLCHRNSIKWEYLLTLFFSCRKYRTDEANIHFKGTINMLNLTYYYKYFGHYNSSNELTHYWHIIDTFDSSMHEQAQFF
jgi:hypothetical protein